MEGEGGRKVLYHVRFFPFVNLNIFDKNIKFLTCIRECNNYFTLQELLDKF